MNHAARFEPPSIRERSMIPLAKYEAYNRRPAHGEARIAYACVRPGCRGTITATVQAGGHISRGRCSSGCGVTWCE